MKGGKGGRERSHSLPSFLLTAAHRLSEFSAAVKIKDGNYYFHQEYLALARQNYDCSVVYKISVNHFFNLLDTPISFLNNILGVDLFA